MHDTIGNEQVLRKLILQMNSSAPSRRIRLDTLLLMEKPEYDARDGRKYSISRTELLQIKEIADRKKILDMKLPIVLFADASFEQSVWRVDGEAECKLISEILGKEQNEDSIGRMLLYAPHLAELRRKLPTATVCLFIM